MIVIELIDLFGEMIFGWVQLIVSSLQVSIVL